MSWIASYWIWIILIGGMMAMHLRHGGHGGHLCTSRRSGQGNPPEGAHGAPRTQPPTLDDEVASAHSKHRGC